MPIAFQASLKKTCYQGGACNYPPRTEPSSARDRIERYSLMTVESSGKKSVLAVETRHGMGADFRDRQS
jgi:hypothetical protein